MKDDDFDVSGGATPASVVTVVVAPQAQPPAPSVPAAVASPASPEPTVKEDDGDEEPAKPKYNPGANQAIPVVTEAQNMDLFRARVAAAAEHHLKQLALAHPEVQALIDEVASLRKKLAKLEPKPKK